MFFKLFRLRLEKEIQELKSLHRIELAEKDAAFQNVIKDKEREMQRIEADLKKDHEIKTREMVSLLKLESQQKTKQLEIDNQRAIDAIKKESSEELLKAKEEVLKSTYGKLSEELAKLHQEGNITTRFTQDLALKMFESMPTQKMETKVITKGEKE